MKQALHFSLALALTSSAYGCDEATAPAAAPCPPGEVCAPGSSVGSAGGGATAGSGAGSTAGAPVRSDLPCEVEEILESRCGLCHGSSPSFGAPTALASSADFASLAAADPTRTRAAVALERVTQESPIGRMPPVGQPQLDDAELATLDAWLQSGAPAGGGCEPAAAGAAGSGGTSGGAGGQLDGGTAPPPEGVTCHKLTAHGDTPDSPFPVGIAPDTYYNFTFDAPWEGVGYATEMKAIIDNTDAIHHWLLFKNFADAGGGTTVVSTGAHPEGELIALWAPGGDDIQFAEWGDDIAFELGSDVSYTLEVHYNSSDASAMDRSGVEVCLQKEKPANLASISWLGSDAIFGTSAAGTCAPGGDEPIRILGWMPHMHKKGVKMTAVVNRADGTKETLHDMPFDFNYQILYKGDVTLMPGDSITTSCEYNAFTTFGESTDSEMCYLFTLAYPAGALRDIGPLGAAAHGGNACLGI